MNKQMITGFLIGASAVMLVMALWMKVHEPPPIEEQWVQVLEAFPPVTPEPGAPTCTELHRWIKIVAADKSAFVQRGALAEAKRTGQCRP